MVFVAELAHRTGRIGAELLERHRKVLSGLGLPTTWTGDFDALLATMRMDKKTRGDLLRLVVLDGLAEPAILEGPDEELLRASYRALA